MKTPQCRIIAFFILMAATAASGGAVEYRIGGGLSIHGSNLAYDPGYGGNIVLEVGGRSETGHFLGLHLGYAGFLYDENKRLFHLGEIGFTSILNIAHYKPNPYAVLGLGYSFTAEGLDNGAYFQFGLGWKHRLSERQQLFIQGTVNLGVNDQKGEHANDPGYSYILVTVGLGFYSP